MEIWKKISRKTRELVGWKCDTCGKIMDTQIITLEFGYGHSLDELTCHFCKNECLLKYILAEIQKEKPNDFIYGNKKEDKNG
jgi:hypothetical protein